MKQSSATKNRAVLAKIKSLPKTKEKPADDQQRVQASAATEKTIAEKSMVTTQRKVVELNTMSDDDKKELLFGTQLSSQLGKMVGKVDPKDPYRAILPKGMKG